MRSVAILSTILAALSAACGQPLTPTSPAATEGSLRRIVDDVSGGNVGVCSITHCLKLEGEVALTSTAGTLTGVYTEAPGPATATGVQDPSQPRDFDITSGVMMTATGRLADLGLGFFFLAVSPQSATVRVSLNGPNNRYFFAEGTAIPEFRITSDTSCTSGKRIETTMTFNLEHLGRTQIVDNHCIR